ncbi:acid-soluble spore protein N [Ectobacillus ponti]|uniref:Acid-soluble spore protein N n=1 Tax=Ectobacillus ponti TaxID=2961894 RepID=A0AA42BT57_9BACI|nr:acid-soluble spore protein N [Ectobacillus ponti]MCP8969133.1 acid-soluble spore protein N [Ectobacillus ponti]
MGNPKRNSAHFRPAHTGAQPRDVKSNNGRKLADKTGKEPIADHG